MPTIVCSMPVLSNPKHELFALALAKGKTQVEAQLAAGYEPNDGNAAQMAAQPDISSRVMEINGRAAARAEVTVASLLDKLDQMIDGAAAEKQFSAAISGIKEKGVLSGKRIERSERGAPGEFDWMENAGDDFIEAIVDGTLTLDEVQSRRQNNSDAPATNKSVGGKLN